jgi:hypothetical protein
MLKLSCSYDSVQMILLKILTEWVIYKLLTFYVIFQFLAMLNTIVRAGAVGARAASC